MLFPLEELLPVEVQEDRVKNNIIFLFALFFVGCKIQDGDNTLNSCSSPDGCYEQYLACGSTIYYYTHESKDFNISISDTDYYFAQSFKLQRQERLSSFTVALQKAGSPTGNMYMELRADCSGNPCSSALDTSGNLLIENVSTTVSNTERTFSFSNKVTLSANTTYWALLSLPLGGQSGTTIYMKMDNGDLYAEGKFKTSNNAGTSWNEPATSYDAFLKINVCE